jgi:hypothetical protein
MLMLIPLAGLAVCLMYREYCRRRAARWRARMRNFDSLIDSVRETQRQERDRWQR